MPSLAFCPTTAKFPFRTRLAATQPQQKYHRRWNNAPPQCAATAAPTTPGLVFSPSEFARFDSGAVCSPVVRRYLSDEGDRYVMWYSGRPAVWPDASRTPQGTLSGFVGLALSDDGVTWSRERGPCDNEAVLQPNSEDWWWFDTAHLAVGDVAMDSNDMVRAESGVYFMYYSGADKEIVRMDVDGRDLEVPGLRSRIGLALSKDGEHFTRIEGDFPSGAVLDVGEPGTFDELFVAAPNLIRPRNPKTPAKRYIMHYFTFDGNRKQFAVGRAVSKDGFLFKRDAEDAALVAEGVAAETFAAKGVSRCCVVERKRGTEGKRFVMFVEVVDAKSVHSIAMCESDDCESWGELQVVLAPTEESDAWDGAGVSHPNAVVVGDGALRLYYTGKRRNHDISAGRGTCIGLAESEGEDWTKLRRVTAMSHT